MVDLPSAPDVARRVADALEHAHIPYAIGGAISYTLYGPARATYDVDVNVFVDPGDLDPVFDAFETLGPIDRERARASATERGDFRFFIDGMRVDVFVPSIPLVWQAAQRVKTATLMGRPFQVLSAEDIVLFKLLFYRAKDISDVRRLVALMGNELDREYIRGWLTRIVGDDDARIETWDAMTH